MDLRVENCSSVISGIDVCDDACFVGAAVASGSKSDLRTNESRVLRPGMLSVGMSWILDVVECDSSRGVADYLLLDVILSLFTEGLNTDAARLVRHPTLCEAGEGTMQSPPRNNFRA